MPCNAIPRPITWYRVTAWYNTTASRHIVSPRIASHHIASHHAKLVAEIAHGLPQADHVPRRVRRRQRQREGWQRIDPVLQRISSKFGNLNLIIWDRLWRFEFLKGTLRLIETGCDSGFWNSLETLNLYLWQRCVGWGVREGNKNGKNMSLVQNKQQQGIWACRDLCVFAIPFFRTPFPCLKVDTWFSEWCSRLHKVLLHLLCMETLVKWNALQWDTPL